MRQHVVEQHASRGPRTGATAAGPLLTAAFVSSLIVHERTAVGAPEDAPSERLVSLRRATGDLGFSRFLGGLEWDEAPGAATDISGNSYVTGFTLSDDFPRVGDGTRGHAAILD